MFKDRLLTPGPTEIPLRIFKAMQQPMMHHRTESFRRLFVAVQDGLKELMRAPNRPILLAGSGTAAMEAALLNTVSPGDTIIVLNGGKFGERWLDLAGKLELNAVEIVVPWGETVDDATLERVLRANPAAKLFCMQYCETSTAILHPVPEITAQVKRIAPECLTVVDAISAIGSLPIHLDRSAIDILVGALHKAFMLPPGLALLFMNDTAWRTVAGHKTRSLYFNLQIEREMQEKGTTAWTPALNHILGLAESLAMIREEGVDNFYARHAQLSTMARAGLGALGLKLLPERHPSPGVSAAFTPSAIDAEKLRGIMRERWQVRIAGGQDRFKGKIIRIGHMGQIDGFDILSVLAALELGLNAMGHAVELGTSGAAALKAADDTDGKNRKS